MATEVKFDPKKSQVAGRTKEDFIRDPLESSLQTVPGIGPAFARKIAKEDDNLGNATNAYQLVGKFLTLRPDEPDVKEHCDKFWDWLKAKGVDSGSRSGIVLCIAEKLNAVYPGIYDPSLWG